MSTAAYGAPRASSAAAVRALNPQAGASGVPFMKRMTGCSLMAPWMASRMGFSSDMRCSWGLGGVGLEREGVDRAADLGAEDVVDEAVLLEAGEAGELLGDHRRAEVVPGARPVLHVGARAREGGLDAILDLRRGRHVTQG